MDKIKETLKQALSLSWFRVLEQAIDSNKIPDLLRWVQERRNVSTIVPSNRDIFRAFELTPPEKVKVVIMGQDPFPNPNDAMGLAFSSRDVNTPPSLKTIFEELKLEYPKIEIKGNDLSWWAKQGVLLLNSSLTTEAFDSNAHRGIGWDGFVVDVISYLNTLEQPIVYLLWGKYARGYSLFIDNPNALILFAAHPSPYNNGKFLGCGHFIMANSWLSGHNRTGIDWNVRPV